MFDLKNVPEDQRAFARKISIGVKNLLIKELSYAISELRALKKEVQDEGFILGSKEDYTYHQRRFLDPIMNGIGRRTAEQLNKIEKGELREGES